MLGGKWNLAGLLLHPGARMLAIGLIVFVSLAGLLPKLSQAALDTPQILSYQGRLTDAQKVTVPDGARAMAFIIYDAATLGNCEWTAAGTCGTPTTVSITVTDGLFNVMLGASPQIALPDALFNTTEERWLEVRIDGETLTPRRRIVSSATALQAGNASLLDSFDTSQVGGAVAFVPVTDSSGNLVLTQNLTVDTNTLFVESSTDRVGIGTTTPAATFNIKNQGATGGTQYEVLRLQSNAGGAGSGPYMQFQNDASTDLARISAIDITGWGGALALMTNLADGAGVGSSEERMRIDHNGNVGIGTTTPDFKLQVDGSIAPEADNTYDLGSPVLRWRDLYLGPSSLNIYNQANATNYDAITLGYESNVATLRSGRAGTGTARAMSLAIDRAASGSGADMTLQAGGAVSGGTNIAGGSLNLNAGIATGSGVSSINFYAAGSGTAGTSDSSPALRLVVQGDGLVRPGSGTSFNVNTNFYSSGDGTYASGRAQFILSTTNVPMYFRGLSGSIRVQRCVGASNSCSSVSNTTIASGATTDEVGAVRASDGFPTVFYKTAANVLTAVHCTDATCTTLGTPNAIGLTLPGSRVDAYKAPNDTEGIAVMVSDDTNIYYFVCQNPTASTPCSSVSTLRTIAQAHNEISLTVQTASGVDRPLISLLNGDNLRTISCTEITCGSTTSTSHGSKGTIFGGFGGFNDSVSSDYDVDGLGAVVVGSEPFGDCAEFGLAKCANASCTAVTAVFNTNAYQNCSGFSNTAALTGIAKNPSSGTLVISGLASVDSSSRDGHKIVVCNDNNCSSRSTYLANPSPQGPTLPYGIGGAAESPIIQRANGDVVAGGSWRIDGSNWHYVEISAGSPTPTGVALGNSSFAWSSGYFGGDVNMRRLLASEFIQVGSQSADPGSASNGAVYYNSTDGKLRCYENATWKDCVSNASPTVITTDGSNIGINTTVYSAKLNVADSTASDATAELMTLRRLRSDATAPGAADFGSDLTYRLESFTDNSDINAVRIRGAWEGAQTDDTTARDSYLSFSTMLNNTLGERARFTSAGNFVPGLDNTYDLGTSALRWKTLHLGPGSLVVHNDATDTNKISVNFSGATGQLVTDSATPLKITTGVNVGINMTTAGNVGIGTAAPTVPLAFDGNTAVTVGQERSTSGAGGALTIRSASAQSGGSNLAGGSLILTGGTSTGSGASSIQFQTATAGASGTADRAPTTKATLSGAGDFTLSGDYLAAAAGSGSSTTEVNTISDAAMNLVRAVTLVPSDNEPVHAWINGSNLFIRKCNDVNCAAATSSATLDTTVSGDTSLSGIIGSDGNPFFAYRDNTGAVRVARCTDTNCSSSVNNTVTAATSSNTNTNVTTSAVLMPDNSVAIVYVTAVSGSESDTYYFRCTNPLHGTTPCSTISPVAPENMSSSYAAHAQTPMVQVSSDNMPIVFWWGRVNFDDQIRAVKCGDTDCTLGSQTSTTLVGPDEQKGIFSTARLSSGLPVITSSMAGTSQGCGGIQPRIYYTKCTNASCSTYSNVTLYQGVASQCVVPSTAVRVQTSGLPIIAYTDGNNNASFVTCNDDSCTTTSSVASFTPAPTNTGGVTMAINPDGDAIVRYGNNGSTNYVARILLSSVVFTGTDLGSSSSRFANGYFAGEVKVGSLTIDGTSPNGFLNVGGHIKPTLDDTYDLGSSSLRWRDLYLGPTTLHIASTAAETTTARDWKLSIQETDGATEGNFRLLEGATEILNATPTGNVGIGTTSPGNRLTIGVDGSAATPAISLGTVADSNTGIFHPTTDALSISNGGVETARFHNTTVSAGYGGPGLIISNQAPNEIGSATLMVSRDDGILDMVMSYGVGAQSGSFLARGARGTIASPTATLSGDQIGTYTFAGQLTTAVGSYFRTASIRAYAAQNFLSDGTAGTDMAFFTYPNGATNGTQLERMRILNSGNVGIGTTTPDNAFDVVGTIDSTGFIRSTDAAGVPGTGTGIELVYPTGAPWSGTGIVDVINRSTDAMRPLTLNASDITFRTSTTGATSFSQPRMTIDASGNVGIGATNPLGMLDISKDGAAAIQYIWAYGSGGSTYPLMELLRSRGTRASPSPALNGDILGAFAIGGQYNTTFGNANGSAAIVATATEDFTASANGTSLDFQTSTTGTAVPASRMFIGSTGNIGIGDTTPTDARLDIDAGTLATGTNALNVSGTLPASGSTQIGNRFDTTTSSGGTGAVIGIFAPITGAYTGTDNTISIYGHNDVAGTATFDPVAFNSSTMSGNLAVLGLATGVTAGTNVGSRGIARSGSGTNIGVQGSVDVGAAVGVNSLNYGVTGVANAAHNGGSTTQRHIGVGGFAVSGDFNVGGYFGLNAAAPTYDATAALIADNAAIAAPIFLARDNGTAVLTIADDGALSTTSTTTLGDDTGADTLTVNTGTSNVDIDTRKVSGTLLNLAYGAATTLTGATTGQLINLSTNVTADDQSITGLQVNLPTQSITALSRTIRGLMVNGAPITTATSGTTTADMIFVSGSDINEGAGTNLSTSGVHVVTRSISGGGTQRGFYVTVGSAPASGTHVAFEAGPTASAGATNVAYLVDTGWDRDIQFIDDTPTMVFAEGARMSWSDSVNELALFSDLSTNFGLAVDAGAFMSRNSAVADEFNVERSDLTADTAGAGGNGFGDAQAWGVYESTASGCSFSTLDDAVNGIFRLDPGATTAGCMAMLDSAANNRHDILDADNLPLLLMKAKPTTVSADNVIYIGMSDDTDGTVVAPNDFIGFSNDDTTPDGNWYGVARSGGTQSTTASCGAASTTQFALMKVEVRSATDVHFFIDTDVSNGVSWSECGTGLTTNIPTTALAPQIHYQSRATAAGTLDVDFFRAWQDDSKDQVTNYVSKQHKATDTENRVALAQLVPAKNLDLIPGTLVAMDPLAAVMGAEPTKIPHDPYLLGVVVKDASLVLGNGTFDGVKVATSGRVSVKVSDANGSIKKGDWLTSSTIPGIAMKATQQGSILGYALQNADAASDTVMIQLQVQSGFPVNGASQLASNTTQDFKIYGDVDFANYSITNIRAIRGMNWSIGEDGALVVSKVTTGEIVIKQSPEKQTIGSGEVPAQHTHVTISNPSVHTSSKIFISWRGIPGWIVDQAEGSFTVQLLNAIQMPTKFDYWVVQVDGEVLVQTTPTAPAVPTEPTQPAETTQPTQPATTTELIEPAEPMSPPPPPDPAPIPEPIPEPTPEPPTVPDPTPEPAPEPPTIPAEQTPE